MSNNNTYIQFSSEIYSVFEKDQPFPNQIEVTLTRSGNIDNYSNVEVNLASGTLQDAQLGADYDVPSGLPQTVIFSPGETSKNIIIDIYDDFQQEGTENV